MWLSDADLKDLLGAQDAKILTIVMGGQRVYVPRTASADHPIARAIGLRGMEVLCAAYAGEVLYLPNGREKNTARRRARKLLTEGKSLRQVADACDITIRYAAHISAELREERAAPTQGSLLG